MQLVTLCYTITARFPKGEWYGLASQVRRAAVSVPANIAEGYGRLHRGDYLRFLSMANGSLKELETEVEIASRMGYVRPDHAKEFAEQADELGRMLRSLTRRLSSNSLHPTP
jgi:four helix bundle protein